MLIVKSESTIKDCFAVIFDEGILFWEYNGRALRRDQRDTYRIIGE